MIVAARVRFRHRGCYSEALPRGMRIVHWGHDEGDCMVTVTGKQGSDFDGVIESMRPFVDAPPRILDRTDTTIVVRCLCRERKTPAKELAALGVAFLWPVVFEDGLEMSRILAPSQEALEQAMDMLRANGEIQVERITYPGPDGLAIDSLADAIPAKLSPRQAEVLQHAVSRGYYRVPRSATISEMAAELGLAPSTFHEHLQKAEAQIVNRLADATTLP